MTYLTLADGSQRTVTESRELVEQVLLSATKGRPATLHVMCAGFVVEENFMPTDITRITS